jgi:hypothetical protein
MVMEAYFDESGIHGGAKVCVVGGFYGKEGAWKNFTKQWNAILNKFPELSETGFHAKDFFKSPRQGIYREWTDEKAGKLLNYLVKCVSNNLIRPIGYGVIVDDFEKLSLKNRLWLTGAKFRASDGKHAGGGCPSKSYYLPFMFSVLGACQISNTTHGERLHFFAGLDRTFAGYATQLHKFLREDVRIPPDLRSKLGGIDYPLAKDTPGIQAADLLVHLMYQHSINLAEQGQLETPRILRQLSKRAKQNQKFTLFNAEAIREMEDFATERYASIFQNQPRRY